MADLSIIEPRFTADNDRLSEDQASQALHAAPLDQPLIVPLHALLKQAQLSWVAKMKAALRGKTGLTKTLEFNSSLLVVMNREALRGRAIVLLGQGDDIALHRIAQQLPFTAHMLDKTPDTQALSAQWPAGFIYVGSTGHDLPFWQAARSAVGVNLSTKTAKALAAFGKPMVLLSAPR
ncbi:MAG: hypothetical protein AB8B88_06690 [Devosiaceae bacterium]